MGLAKWQLTALSPALSPITFSLGYRVLFKIWKCHQKIDYKLFFKKKKMMMMIMTTTLPIYRPHF